MATVVEYFKTAQVARISGFSVRQLDYWATSGMLVPSVNRSSGPGTRRLYNFDDLVRLRFIKQLRQGGWSIQKIRKALRFLDEFMTDGSAYRNIKIIPDKKTLLVLCETEEKQQILLDALVPGGQQVLWIVLELLRAETRKNAIQLLSLSSDDNREFDIAI